MDTPLQAKFRPFIPIGLDERGGQGRIGPLPV